MPFDLVTALFALKAASEGVSAPLWSPVTTGKLWPQFIALLRALTLQDSTRLGPFLGPHELKQ